MTTELLPQQQQPTLEQSVQRVQQWASALKIETTDQRVQAGEGVRRIRALLAEVGKIHDPAIEAAHVSHKAALAAKARLADPLKAADKAVGAAILKYERDQENLRLAEVQRLRREEDARVAAEKNKLADEAAKLEADRKAAEAATTATAETADPLKTAEAEIELVEKQQAVEAKQQELAAVAPRAVYVPPSTPAIRGQTIAKTWKARVVDFAALIKAAAETPALQSYLLPNESALNATARGRQGPSPLPGVEFYEEASFRARR